MQILRPHLSCIVSPAELPIAVEQGYGEIYIVTAKGPYKQIRLTHGRMVRMKVDSIPGVADDVVEEINFLPAGKIPYQFLTQIVQFFRAVMTVKKADQEAMAHVLWNPTDGYHIGIPTQQVSKASVRYDFDDVKPGDVIVLDIHSHNTMSAFFSGTDNNDDKRSICYSGVAGHLDRPEPAFVWRFNYLNMKKEAVLSDIFDVEVQSPVIDQSWLDKVTTGFAHTGPFWSRETGGYSFPKSETHLTWANQGGAQDVRGPGFYRGGQGLSRPPESRAAGSNVDLLAAFGVSADEGLWADYDNVYAATQPNHRDLSAYNRETLERRAQLLGEMKREDDNDADLLVTRSPAEIPDPSTASDPDLSFMTPDDQMVAEFGPAAAEAFEQIDAYMEDLNDADELLLQVLRNAYDKLSPQAQAAIQTNGF